MKSQLDAEWDALPAGPTRMQIDARRKAHFKLVLFKEQAFDGDQDLHATPKEAALCIQCDPPPAFAGSGLTKLCCAAGESVQAAQLLKGLTLNSLQMTQSNFFTSPPSPLAAGVVLWMLMQRSVLFA